MTPNATPSIHNTMNDLKEIFCRYDMVCDNPSGVGLEIRHMPEFFDEMPLMETGKMHLHGFYEIVWFQDGGGVHYVDFSQFEVTPGSIFIIAPGQIHSFDCRHDRKGVVLKFCTGLYDGFIGTPLVHIQEQDSEGLMLLIRAMEEELRNPGLPGHGEAVRALVQLFMVRIGRSGAVSGPSAPDPLKTSHKAFLSFRKLIEENYFRLHSVKDYAYLLHMTTKTLTLYVRECSPYTPLELINERIILEAKRLLRYSVFTVKETAFRLGFEDPSYFAKFFKRIVKQSPADYRESFQD